MKYLIIYLLAQIVSGVHLGAIAFVSCQAPEEVKVSNNIDNISRDRKTSLAILCMDIKRMKIHGLSVETPIQVPVLQCI